MKQLARHSLIALLCCLPMFAPRAASAQSAIYRWIDAEGGVHFSQGVDSVPPRFRAGAVSIGYDKPPEPSAPSTPTPQPGTGQVRFIPGQPIMVTARINDAGSAQLMLDTGATRTLINPSVLSALGVNSANAARAVLKGVTGEAEVDAVKLDSIEIGGAKYGPLIVLSHDTGFGPLKVDGLLGRDYLDNFTVTIDNGAGLLTLTPK
jgi:predicted aspartyl protease